MSELTDLEICQKIAEIEGYKTCSFQGYDCCAYTGIECDKIDGFAHIPYSPLTNDALCFRLMIKYGVWFSPVIPNVKIRDYKQGKYKPENYMANHTVDGTPNKAICLAIIKSKATTKVGE
jgi:hypothetical protein